MEVNSSISNLMREWLTEGMDRDADKLKSFVPPTTVFQPRPERLGLGATPHPSLSQCCGTVDTVRRNISKRIKSTSEHTVIGCTARRHYDIDKGLNEDEGSRSLSFCNHVSTKLTTSDALLKIQKKRKQRKKNKRNIIHDKEPSSPMHSITTLEERIPSVIDHRTHKPKKWKLRLRYGLFRPQTNCTRLRWRKCFVKRIP